MPRKPKTKATDTAPTTDEHEGGTATAVLDPPPASNAEFKLLPIDELHESALNPRKTFNQQRMDELTASVRAKGVITPLLVRPSDDGYEIAAGHRRLRAAKAAGCAVLPAVVRDMDDTTFLEILVLENDERADLHPLEEAEGYNTLMRRAGYTVERIAERRGCSIKYVYDRVKLLDLIPDAKELFRADRFTAGHAILLARLTPEQQEKAISPYSGALFEHEDSLFGRDGEGGDLVGEGESDEWAGLKCRSVRELQAWIDTHVRFDVTTVDPVVHQQTAEVVAPLLEAEEKIVKITHDKNLHPDAKAEGERTLGPQAWKRADGKENSEACEHAVTGVIVAGFGRGDAFRVCTAKKKCKTHWGAEMKEAEKRAKALAQGKEPAAPKKDAWELERERQAARQAAWKSATPQLLDAVVQRVAKAGIGALGDILLQDINAHNLPDELKKRVPRGKSADELVRHSVWLILSAATSNVWNTDQMTKRLKAFGVDVAGVLKKAAAAEKAAAKAAGKDGKSKRSADDAGDEEE
jgi:ParB/RepB/Spo0J family partition protein